ncbi:hypothetical protein PFISCL1PPCAC_10515, partial [Pristionchus fissidentatus]
MSLLSCCLQGEPGFEGSYNKGKNTKKYKRPDMSGEDEEFKKIEVKQDEFSGLIGNIAGNILRDKVGGDAGNILAGLADNVLSGGGNKGGFGAGGGGFGGGGGGGGNDLGGLLGGLLSGGGNRGNQGGFGGGGGGYNQGG